MDTATRQQLDLDALYRALSIRLERIVRRQTSASDDVIEEACQIAWSRLADPAHGVPRDSAFAWLVTTARREAVRLVLRGAALAALADGDEAAVSATSAPAPEEVAELRSRLDAVALLPKRQQRVLWLHAAGHTYVEIARYTGDTRRTVERQLLRARRSARRLAA
jgi:RNA polymerase sigma factor (sigma-70 family)